MERYHIYRLGLAILFYAIYCPRPMVVNGSTFDDVIGTINDTNERLARALDADYGYEDSYQGVQGRPGVDFPVFGQIPRTTFSCQDLESGYYADLDTDCQVFHICNEGRKVSFLCPNGTIFQQSDLICDWWFKVNCTNSPNLYEESAENLKESNLRRKQFRKVDFQQDSSKESRGNLDTADNRRNSGIETQITQESASFYSNNAYTLQEVTEKGNKIFEGSKPYTQRNYDNNVANHKRIYVDNPVFDYSENNQPKQTVPTLISSDINAAVQRHSVRNKAGRGRNSQASTTVRSFTSQSNFESNGYKATVTTTPVPVSSTTPKQPTVYPPVIGVWQSDRPNSAKSDLKTASSSSLFNGNNQQNNNNINISNKTTSSRKKGKTIQLSLSSNLTPTSSSSSTRGKESPIVTSNRSAHGKSIKSQATLNANDLKNQKKIKLTLSSSLTNNRPESSTRRSAQNKNYVYSPTVPPFTKQTLPVGHFITKDSSSTNSPVPLSTSTSPETTTSFIRTTQPQTVSTTVRTTVSTKPFRTAPTSTPQSVRSTTPGLIYKFTSGVGNTKGFPTPTEEISTTILSTIPPFLSTTLAPKGFSFQESVTSTPNVEISNPSTRLPPVDFSSATINPYSTNQYNPPTTPTTFASNTHITESILENVHNMINSLRDVEVVEPKYVEPRPGLIIPPSAGPQTLHSLAIYFANALDSIVGNGTEELDNRAAEIDTEAPTEVAVTTTLPEGFDKVSDKSEEEIAASLLTRMTVDKYNMLFEEKSRTPENADGEEIDLATRSGATDVNNDLEGQHSKYPVQTPRARQLAQVFTQALSAYLDDPSTFRRVLQEVRPTEPPPIFTTPETRESTIDFSLGTEEDEVLNFSDADVKSDNNRFPVPALTSTTTTTSTTTNAPSTITFEPSLPSIAEINDHFLGNAIENNKKYASEVEHLQSADSQSFVPHFNTLSRAKATTGSRTPKKLEQSFNKDNQFSQPKEFQPVTDSVKVTEALPTNHWTSSSHVTKLWETTLFVNPSAINTKLTTSEEVTEKTTTTTTTTTTTFSPEITSTTLQTIIVEDVENTTEKKENIPDKSDYVQESNGVFRYTFKTLPTIEVNSTEIRGLLIDFMNSTKSSTETPDQVKRILQKLNTTEEDFLKKMRQINKNPLTRRLILLLVSESEHMPETQMQEMKSTLIKTLLNVSDAEISTGNKPVYDALVNLSSEIQEAAASGLTVEKSVNETQTVTSSTVAKKKEEDAEEQEKKSDSLKTLVDPYLVEGHHDTRALELLKSLYTIAAKWGK